MKNSVQVFKGSINSIQDSINNWARQNRAVILSTSMCFDEQASAPSHVFVLYTTE